MTRFRNLKQLINKDGTYSRGNLNLHETIKALEQAWETKFSKKEIKNIVKNYYRHHSEPQPKSKL